MQQVFHEIIVKTKGQVFYDFTDKTHLKEDIYKTLSTFNLATFI